MVQKKKKSTVERITKVVAWFMLIAIVGSALIGTGIVIYNQFFR